MSENEGITSQCGSHCGTMMIGNTKYTGHCYDCHTGECSATLIGKESKG